MAFGDYKLEGVAKEDGERPKVTFAALKDIKCDEDASKKANSFLTYVTSKAAKYGLFPD